MVAYALTIFSGAFLLFLVQPLIGKFILPWFGGAPGVWTVCMLFFQVLLLVGYAYAHLTSRFLTPRAQAALHITVLALAVLSLPITPVDAWKPGPNDDPTARILLLLAASIGLSYFALSTTGPLLQRWYSMLRGEVSPYRLFSLSNAGSLLALLGYPFAIEPLLARQTQVKVWSWAMVVFAGLCGWCAVGVFRHATGHSEPSARPAATDVATPSRRDYALWLALPTLASVMLLATTNKLCQDLAVIPFLWVLPLSLYLLSFVLCFDNPRWYNHTFFGVALLVCIAIYEPLARATTNIIVSVGGHAMTLFVICMICHGELYRLRPHPRHLTAFYLMVATGGAMGGALVALVAPLLFVYYEEYEIGILACGLLALLVHYFDEASPLYRGRPRLSWAFLLVAFFGLGYPLGENVYQKHQQIGYAERDFHGALYVRHPDSDMPTSAVNVLWSGNTKHGMQVMIGKLRRQPTTYFAEETGIGLALLKLSERKELNIGTIGLGAGTLAAYGRSGDRMRFYEINPRVEQIAREQFTYVADSPAHVEVVLGDARLSLEKEAPQEFDVLVLDAFTSDAIPVHLLTREAFEIYVKHLRPNGVIAAHISNRHLDLRPVLAALGKQFDMTTLLVQNEKDEERWWVMLSTWVLMTRDSAFLSSPAVARAAQRLDDDSVTPLLWTDERTSLLRVLK